MLADLIYSNDETTKNNNRNKSPEKHATDVLTGNTDKNDSKSTHRIVAVISLYLIAVFIVILGTFFIVNIAYSDYWNTLNIFLKISFDVLMAIGAASLAGTAAIVAIAINQIDEG